MSIIGAASFGFGAGKAWFRERLTYGGKSSIVCHQGFWTVFLAEGVWLTAKQLGPQKWLVDDWDHLRTVQVQGRCVYIERPALLSERLPLTCAAKLSAPMKAT